MTNLNQLWPPFSMLRLGLIPSFAPPNVLASISQLPEVEAVLTTTTRNQEAALQRATEIFGQMQAGSAEHLALWALTAEYYQTHGRFDKALEALQTLAEIQTSNNNDDDDKPFRLQLDVQLAHAKVLWYQGDFGASRSLCEDILDQENSHQLEERFPFYLASARQGQALNRLLQATKREEVFSLKDPPRMVVALLERVSKRHRRMPATPVALAQYNYGCAVVIWSQHVQRLNNLDHVPIDAAMRTWKDALTQLEQERNRQHRNGTLSRTIQARLQAYLAWGVLYMAEQLGMEDTEKAMELAGEALRLCDSIKEGKPSATPVEGLGRILGLLASCYHQTGQAVTAEGLLQSALDTDVVGPQQALERREVLETYSRLCHDWEKREGQGDQLAAQAKDPAPFAGTTGWNDKSPAMFGGLWFWTPNLFAEP